MCAMGSGYFVPIPDSIGDDFAQGFYRVRRYWRNTRAQEGAGRVNTMMRAILVALLLLTVSLTASTPSWRMTPAPAVLTGSAAVGSYFDYVLVIIMENRNLCDILASCGATAAPYLSGLAGSYGVATKDFYCHANPSLPNYLCLSGGSDFGCTADASPNTIACTQTAWGATNIVDRLESAGLTWKGYMEDMPSNCYASDSGNYVVHHNPFMYYSDIANNATRCAQVVPAGTSDSALLNDLASESTSSNFMWLTPNKCNDMHSCSVHQGDTYMSGLVPQILGSTLFTTKRAALFVTYDEDVAGTGQPVYTLWAGSLAKTGYLSSFDYNHYSFRSTVEANWKLASLTANDRDAPHMAEFFVGQPSRNESVLPTAPFPLGIVLGIAIPVAAVAIVAFLLLRRRKGTKGSPAKPGPSEPGAAKPPTAGDEGADEDEWEI